MWHPLRDRMVLLASVQKYRELTSPPEKGKVDRGTQVLVKPGPGKEWAHGTEQRHEGLVGHPMIRGIVRSLLPAGTLLTLTLIATAGVRLL